MTGLVSKKNSISSRLFPFMYVRSKGEEKAAREVENTISPGRTAQGGKTGRQSSRVDSTDSWEQDALLMAENWSWESSSPDRAPDASTSGHRSSPLRSSPLRDSPSRSSPLQSASSPNTSREAMRGDDIQPGIQPPALPGRGEATRLTLVETLQTFLTSLEPPPATSPGRSLSDPSGTSSPTTLRQSRSSGALSGSTSRPMKRRSRTSRRIPTTVVEVTLHEFRETVHRLTGIAAPTPAPMRPVPQRAGPSTFLRPTPQIQAGSVHQPGSNNPSPPSPSHHELLNSLRNAAAAPPLHTAYWHQLENQLGNQLQQMDASEQAPHSFASFMSPIRSQPIGLAIGPSTRPGIEPGIGHGMDPGIGPGIGPGMDPGIGPGMGPGIGPGIGPGSRTSPPTTSPFGTTTMSQPGSQLSASTSPATMQHTWWDAAVHEQSQSYFMTPPSGPFDGSPSADQSLPDEDPDLSNLDAWFHPDHPGSDYMR